VEDNVEDACDKEYKKPGSTEEIKTNVDCTNQDVNSKQPEEISEKDKPYIEADKANTSSNMNQDAITASVTSKDENQNKLDLGNAGVENENEKKVPEDKQSLVSKLDSQIDDELKNKVDEKAVGKDSTESIGNQVENGVNKDCNLTNLVREEASTEPHAQSVSKEDSRKLLSEVKAQIDGDISKDGINSSQDETNIEVLCKDIVDTNTNKGKHTEEDVDTTAEQDNNKKEDVKEKDTLIPGRLHQENQTPKKLLDMIGNHIVREAGPRKVEDNDDSNNVTSDAKVEQNEENIDAPKCKEVNTERSAENVLHQNSSHQEINSTVDIMNKLDKTESEPKTKEKASKLAETTNSFNGDAKSIDLMNLEKPSEKHVDSVDQKNSLKTKTNLDDSLNQSGGAKDFGSERLLKISDEEPIDNSKTFNQANIDTSEGTNEKNKNPNKPDFYRADTVVEPILIKKTIQHLGDDSQDDQTDDNNNSNKEETRLEKEVREAVDEVIKETRKMDAEAIEAMLKNLPSVPTSEQLTSKAESTESEPVADDLSSVDSADSVVTVIMKPKQDQEQTRPLPGRAFSTSALEDRVELLDQVQNSLLDELSGKSSKSKFDIEQLRKELHDAATIYKDDEETAVPNVSHEPEMLEYLYDFEPEDPACFDSVLKTPLRELPDILEEEDSPEVSTNLTNEIIINDGHIEIGKEHHRLMHTGEMHDSVLVNNSLGGLVVGSQEHQSQLKHTSEFHDTVLVPLPSGADVKITNASRETSPQSPQAPGLANRMDSGNQTNQQPPGQVFVIIVSGFHLIICST